MSNIQQIKFNPVKKLLLLLSLVFVFFACQVDDITENSNPIIPVDGSVIFYNSIITSQLINITTFDGSFDNFLDQASCIAISLPVTIIINEKEIVINTVNDYEEVASLLDKLDNNTTFVFSYPIQIRTSDHSVATIENLEMLNGFRASCNEENAPDNDIECIDFVYPLQINFYNTNNQIADTTTVMNDENFYDFLNFIDQNTIAELVFPIQVQLYTNETLSLNSNIMLLEIINDNSDQCDEDDDFDFF